MIQKYAQLNIPDKEEFLKWLDKQPWLDQEIDAGQVLALLLYRLCQMEKIVDQIDFKTRTHWVD
ncbi:MAG TPA: hypothetical protein VHE54_14795 [Puia sp.]|nr:hypothetical protein [Puia sp.]